MFGSDFVIGRGAWGHTLLHPKPRSEPRILDYRRKPHQEISVHVVYIKPWHDAKLTLKPCQQQESSVLKIRGCPSPATLHTTQYIILNNI